MEASSARDGDFERDGDFDFGEEAPRTDFTVFDLAGEAARARAGDFAVFDFGGITQMACRTTTSRVLLVKLLCYCGWNGKHVV